MRPRLDPSSKIPVSEQLARELRRRIERGSLAPGERVPPVRDLAGELALAPNTVAKAYRALEAEGLLVGRGRNGTFVAERGASGDAELAAAARAFIERARRLGFGAAQARRAVERALRKR